MLAASALRRLYPIRLFQSALAGSLTFFNSATAPLQFFSAIMARAGESLSGVLLVATTSAAKAPPDDRSSDKATRRSRARFMAVSGVGSGGAQHSAGFSRPHRTARAALESRPFRGACGCATRSPMSERTFCAIDFGTSNSAVAVPDGAAMRLVELEPGFRTMPTAVFYPGEAESRDRFVAPPCEFGRAAIAAYVDGIDGRLMRSMKSILGSSLVEQTTDVGGGRGVRFIDVVATYLRHLRRRAGAAAGAPVDRAVLGRPVFFVDDDPVRDAQAEAALRSAAASAGFGEVEFQYEPIAAAFDYEQGAGREEKVLVADIGGGTSDFSVVRVGPERMAQSERKGDILANHGVHIAGTDFDRRVELAGILPLFGYGALGPEIDGAPAREVPSAVYFDLATWHLINTVYNPQRVVELRAMRPFYADPAHHRRLMTVVTEHYGHDLVARAEAAKIAVASGGRSTIALDHIEPGLAADLDEARALRALDGDLDRIVAAARTTVAAAGLVADDIDALYLTGGSTGLDILSERLHQAFAEALVVRGDRFASVATGLAIFAQRRFAQ